MWMWIQTVTHWINVRTCIKLEIHVGMYNLSRAHVCSIVKGTDVYSYLCVLCVWVNAFISIREIFYKFMCSAVFLQQTCAIHMNFFPFPPRENDEKKTFTPLCYDDANTRKIVMATVEFIYITSNTFILQSLFYTHMCDTSYFTSIQHQQQRLRRWLWRWRRYNCFTFKCTHIIPRALCASPPAHSRTLRYE